MNPFDKIIFNYYSKVFIASKPKILYCQSRLKKELYTIIVKKIEKEYE